MVNCQEIIKVLSIPPTYMRKPNILYVVDKGTYCEGWVTGKDPAIIKQLDNLSSTQIGNLLDLQTIDKSSLVAAINEVLNSNNSIGNYEHVQNTPATIWSGNHTLGRKITAVHVTDTGGNQWECLFDSTDTTFSINVGFAAFAGTAILI
jgi:hypothetical protein